MATYSGSSKREVPDRVAGSFARPNRASLGRVEASSEGKCSQFSGFHGSSVPSGDRSWASLRSIAKLKFISSDRVEHGALYRRNSQTIDNVLLRCCYQFSDKCLLKTSFIHISVTINLYHIDMG